MALASDFGIRFHCFNADVISTMKPSYKSWQTSGRFSAAAQCKAVQQAPQKCSFLLISSNFLYAATLRVPKSFGFRPERTVALGLCACVLTTMESLPAMFRNNGDGSLRAYTALLHPFLGAQHLRFYTV